MIQDRAQNPHKYPSDDYYSTDGASQTWQHSPFGTPYSDQQADPRHYAGNPYYNAGFNYSQPDDQQETGNKRRVRIFTFGPGGTRVAYEYNVSGDESSQFNAEFEEIFRQSKREKPYHGTFFNDRDFEELRRMFASRYQTKNPRDEDVMRRILKLRKSINVFIFLYRLMGLVTFVGILTLLFYVIRAIFRTLTRPFRKSSTQKEEEEKQQQTYQQDTTFRPPPLPLQQPTRTHIVLDSQQQRDNGWSGNEKIHK